MRHPAASSAGAGGGHWCGSPFSAYWAVLLGATLLAAVLTEADVGRGPDSTLMDIDVAEGDF